MARQKMHTFLLGNIQSMNVIVENKNFYKWPSTCGETDNGDSLGALLVYSNFATGAGFVGWMAI